jgi:transcriptional regulator of acetoin/glycerol metabolism
VENAARLMGELDCGALPVVDSSGRLIGIIACSDITTRLIARGITVQYAQVSDCMTHQAFACSLDSSTIEDCMHAMSWHQVKRMPIVDNDHRVIGIISMSDVARHLWGGGAAASSLHTGFGNSRTCPALTEFGGVTSPCSGAASCHCDATKSRLGDMQATARLVHYNHIRQPSHSILLRSSATFRSQNQGSFINP